MSEHDWPKRYHPARYVDGDYVIDEAVTVEGYQLQPATWNALAAWCGGVRVLDYAGNQALAVNSSLDEDDVAHLGDFVMRTDDSWTVSRADGHYQRWAAS
ncbi:hypothetical protein [Pseudonocardia broussonetiae]|uniref:Uncharacterized protein n=1 Tax=Pseudonocardia broussonetiae TaxID=2736640 RepID=A0A6M6JGM9_9PSEU|nr:hypothetical protein [Pseudonocardia broussonetiae]QJY46646.1 hypothetical protein HOP40_13150 [Pseudonocardia broussonetiae]